MSHSRYSIFDIYLQFLLQKYHIQIGFQEGLVNKVDIRDLWWQLLFFQNNDLDNGEFSKNSQNHGLFRFLQLQNLYSAQDRFFIHLLFGQSVCKFVRSCLLGVNAAQAFRSNIVLKLYSACPPVHTIQTLDLWRLDLYFRPTTIDLGQLEHLTQSRSNVLESHLTLGFGMISHI